MDQRGNGAGQATLHIAGTAAIEFIVTHDCSERRNACIPAVAQGDGIHVADIDQPRLVALARHGDYKVAAPGEHLELLNLHGIECRVVQPCQPFLNQHFDIPLNFIFIRARV